MKLKNDHRSKFPDLTSRLIQKPRLLICTDSRSTSLAAAVAGTLKLVFGGVKMSEFIFFFLENLFTHYRDTKTAKALLAVWTLKHIAERLLLL